MALVILRKVLTYCHGNGRLLLNDGQASKGDRLVVPL